MLLAIVMAIVGTVFLYTKRIPISVGRVLEGSPAKRIGLILVIPLIAYIVLILTFTIVAQVFPPKDSSALGLYRGIGNLLGFVTSYLLPYGLLFLATYFYFNTPVALFTYQPNRRALSADSTISIAKAAQYLRISPQATLKLSERGLLTKAPERLNELLQGSVIAYGFLRLGIGLAIHGQSDDAANHDRYAIQMFSVGIEQGTFPALTGILYYLRAQAHKSLLNTTAAEIDLGRANNLTTPEEFELAGLRFVTTVETLSTSYPLDDLLRLEPSRLEQVFRDPIGLVSGIAPFACIFVFLCSPTLFEFYLRTRYNCGSMESCRIAMLNEAGTATMQAWRAESTQSTIRQITMAPTWTAETNQGQTSVAATLTARVNQRTNQHTTSVAVTQTVISLLPTQTPNLSATVVPMQDNSGYLQFFGELDETPGLYRMKMPPQSRADIEKLLDDNVFRSSLLGEIIAAWSSDGKYIAAFHLSDIFYGDFERRAINIFNLTERSPDKQMSVLLDKQTFLATTGQTMTTDFNFTAITWAPDNAHLAFSLVLDGSTAVYIINADGSNLQKILGPRERLIQDLKWSPNSKMLAACDVNPSVPHMRYIILFDVDGTNERELYKYPRPCGTRWSRDGKYLLLSAHEYNIVDIETMQFKYFASLDHPMHWAWSPDGQYVFDGSLDRIYDMQGHKIESGRAYIDILQGLPTVWVP